MKFSMCLFLAACVLLAWSSEAQACTCVARTGAEYFAAADSVFLARARAPQPAPPTGAAPQTPGEIDFDAHQVQVLDVLEVLKGSPGATFELQGEVGVIHTCQRRPQPGEALVAFVVEGELGLCSGNFALEAQLGFLDEALAHGLDAPPQPPAAAFEAALAAAVAEGSPLVAGTSLSVAYAPLAGTEMELGATTVRFVEPGAAEADVTVPAAVGREGLHFVRLRREARDIELEALLREVDGGQLELVAHRSVAWQPEEGAAAPPPPAAPAAPAPGPASEAPPAPARGGCACVTVHDAGAGGRWLALGLFALLGLVRCVRRRGSTMP